MNTRLHMITNIIGFQLGWFAVVLLAAQNQPALGIAAVLLVVLTNFYISENRHNTLIIVATVTLIGTAWDSLLTSLGLLVFFNGMITPYLAPSWIIAMWLLFATTLNVSLRWLYGHSIYAMLLGAIAGPLAYQAGAALGAVSIPDSTTTNIVLAIGWSLLLPGMIKFAQLVDNQNHFRMSTK